MPTLVGADLVRDPGLFGAARERVREAPRDAQRAMISHGAETMPTSIQAAPMPT